MKIFATRENAYLVPVAKAKLAQLRRLRGPTKAVLAGPKGETIEVSLPDRIRIRGGASASGAAVYGKLVTNSAGFSFRSEGSLDTSKDTYVAAYDHEAFLSSAFRHDAAVDGEIPVNLTGPWRQNSIFSTLPPNPDASLAAQVFLAQYLGPAFLQDAYSGTFKNFLDPALNTDPRADGAHSLTLVSNTGLYPYLAAHALKKQVQAADATVLEASGLSPAVLRDVAGIAGGVAMADFDLSAMDFGTKFSRNDRLVVYQLRASLTAAGQSADVDYAPNTLYLNGGLPGDLDWVEFLADPTRQVDSVQAVARHEYTFVPGYVGTLQVLSSQEGRIFEVRVGSTVLYGSATGIALTRDGGDVTGEMAYATTAKAIASAINAFSDLYRASAIADTVYLHAPAGTNPPYVISVTSTGETDAVKITARDTAQAGYMKWASSTAFADPLLPVMTLDDPAVDLNFDAIFYATDEVRARATLTIIEGEVGVIDRVSVNGVVVTHGTGVVVEEGQPTAQTATLLVKAINDGALYSASRSGPVISIRAPKGSGATPNGYPVVVTTNNNLLVTVTDMAAGAPPVEGPMRCYAAFFYPVSGRKTTERKNFLEALATPDVKRVAADELDDTELLLGAVRTLEV